MDNTEDQRQILAIDSDDESEAQENQPNYFDTLPDEIHLEILNRVPSLELESSLSLVCKRFNCIVKDRSLWKRMFVVGPLKLNPGYVEKLTMRPVQCLILCNLTIPSPSLRPVLEATQPSWRLKEVYLCAVVTCPGVLVNIFNKCQQLTKVYLQDIRVNDIVFVALSRNKNLEYLLLDSVRGLEPLCLEIILQNARKLQELYIKCSILLIPAYDPHLLDSICPNLAPSLLHLRIADSFFSITHRHIEDIVRNCPLLQSLILFRAYQLTPRSRMLLENLKHLRILKLPRSFADYALLGPEAAMYQ